MRVCFLSAPMRSIEYNRAQSEYLNDFYNIRLANFSKIMHGVDFDKLSEIATQNISLLAIAAYLKKSKHKISYCDINKTSLEDIPESDVYALGAFSCNYSIALKIAKYIKKRHPSSLVIIGGPHSTFMSRSIVKDGVFDVVVRGEGEIILRNILDAVSKGKDISSVKGITFIREGKVIETPDETEFLDKVMIPDYSLLRGSLPTARVFASRGCPYRCAFCANNAMKGRVIYKDIADIVNELNILYSKFGTRLFYFGDETFTLNEKRAMEIIEIIESFKDDAYWIFQTRPDRLSRRIIKRLSECKKLVEINVGIENVDDHVLRINNKNLTCYKIITGLEMLKRTGKNVLGYWIVGLPGETKETIKKNLKFMKQFLNKGLLYLIEIGCFMPYPGTDIFNNPKKYGIRINSMDFERYTSESIPPYDYPALSSKEIFDSYLRMLREVSKIYRRDFKSENMVVHTKMKKFDKGLF